VQRIVIKKPVLSENQAISTQCPVREAAVKEKAVYPDSPLNENHKTDSLQEINSELKAQ
jgi:hypothetical protein